MEGVRLESKNCQVSAGVSSTGQRYVRYILQTNHGTGRQGLPRYIGEMAYKKIDGSILPRCVCRLFKVEPPVYWNVKEWCDGFRKLLDYMELDRVHLFGASLGGFLAQKFAEINSHCPRVVSLVLCNSFTDTTVFSYNDSAAM